MNREEYRKLFYACNHCIYLDQAYDCGSTLFGIKAMEKYFNDWNKAAVNVERGGPGRLSHFKVADETRELLRKLVNAESGDLIAFTRNTNEGLNAILQGFEFEENDNIITAEIEHESVVMPALRVAETRGVEVRILPTREDERILAEELIALADENTRMILVSHVQSKNGYRIDLEKLGNICRERGIYLIVDAIQSLGLEPFDMQKWHVSAVNAAGYKGLNSVISIAFTAYDRELLKIVHPTYVAAGFCTDIIKTDEGWKLVCSDEENARKMENSSLDNPGIYVLHDALQIIFERGIENIHEDVMKLYDRMYSGLKQYGYPIITPENKSEHLGIISMRPSDPDKMFQFFRSKNIALSRSSKVYIRVSLGGFNNEDDADAFLKAVKEYAELTGRVY
ncbi:MAG: aminotransferase class V-fold PLP-dependent enzyme [Erysipelotrichaceae bacterium]|nr:aminotransferase class V-fold PLP-dependent enzyme [Erysipelotrichaceae bacterium]